MTAFTKTSLQKDDIKIKSIPNNSTDPIMDT